MRHADALASTTRVSAADHDAGTQVVQQRAQSLLVRTQDLLRAIALADVAEDQHHPGDRPFRGANRRRAVRDVVLAAIASEEHGVVGQTNDFTALDHLPGRVDGQLPGARVDDAEHRRQLLADGLRGGPA